MVTVSLDLQQLLHFLIPTQTYNGLQSRVQIVWEHETGNHGLGAFEGKARFDVECVPH